MIKFRSILIINCIVILTSCNPKDPSSKEINAEDDTINYIQKEINLKEEEEEIEDEKTIETAKYNGSWFSISYPSNFTVKPKNPVEKFEDYEFINTDEAYFLSPDKTVEFFVYSPQWGGDPKSYLELSKGETITTEKTTIDEILPDHIYTWVTFENKAEQYTRSYYSKHTESTHLVFGIKYNNQDMYELYKPDYTAFKKSLVQFAD